MSYKAKDNFILTSKFQLQIHYTMDSSYLVEKRLIANLFVFLCIFTRASSPGGGGHSNTSVVHMRDQKSTPKRGFHTILHPILPQKQDFWGEHVWWNRGVWKMTSKCPLLESKKDPFSWKKLIFWPLLMILENLV